MGLLLAAQGTPSTAFADSPKLAPPKPPPAKIEHIEKIYAESILGRPVLDGKGETIGHIVNVLIDTLGDPQAAVIEFAGFLGVGNRKVAVAWSALAFTLKGNRIVIRVTLDAAKLRAMPEYRPSADPVPVAAPDQSTHPSPTPSR